MLIPKARRSGRQSKARGGAEGGTPGQVWSAIKPVKRAAAFIAVAHFVGFGSFTTALLELTLQALCCRLLRRLKSKLLNTL